MARFQIRQGGDGGDDDDDDDAHSDLDMGNGLPRGALLVLRGHHVAALACLARSCATPAAVAPARQVAAVISRRLRQRQGAALARTLAPLDIADVAYLQKLSAIAEGLRASAERLGSATLAGVIDAHAAQFLCHSAPAWLGKGSLQAGEVATLLAHVAAGVEVWGGLGDGRHFSSVPFLLSRLDPAAEPAFELSVASMPERHAAAAPMEIRSRPDPEFVLDLAHPLRLVVRDTLMLCLEAVPATAHIDEAGGTFSLQLEG